MAQDRCLPPAEDGEDASAAPAAAFHTPEKTAEDGRDSATASPAGGGKNAAAKFFRSSADAASTNAATFARAATGTVGAQSIDNAPDRAESARASRPSSLLAAPGRHCLSPGWVEFGS